MTLKERRDEYSVLVMMNENLQKQEKELCLTITLKMDESDTEAWGKLIYEPKNGHDDFNHHHDDFIKLYDMYNSIRIPFSIVPKMVKAFKDMGLYDKN